MTQLFLGLSDIYNEIFPSMKNYNQPVFFIVLLYHVVILIMEFLIVTFT